ncbi:MAG: efflux RND transporter periplasmic adaptor subunit [Planctomycetota bacterium]
MSRKRKLVIIVLILALAGVAGLGLGAKHLLGSATAKLGAALWKTEKLKRGDILVTITTIGTLSPVQAVWVGSQVSGKIEQVLKGPNDPVKKGEVLALVNTELLESDKLSAEVHLSQTQASLSLLTVDKENLVLKEARLKYTLQSKQVAVERAKACLELASKNRQRYEELVIAKVTPQVELDSRLLEEANSRRDVTLMELDIELLKVDITQVESDYRQLKLKVDLAKADVEQAQATLERAKTNLGYAKIVSPIDGVVLEQAIEPGQTIATQFQTPNMFRIASDLTKLRIDARVDEADIGRILAGQAATFEVDAYRGETFNGKVVLVHLQAEEKTNPVVYRVRFEALNPATPERPYGKLVPGMTTSLKVAVTKKTGVLLLPGAALRFSPPAEVQGKPAEAGSTDDTGPKQPGVKGTVYVTNAKGELSAKTVRLGDSDNENFELLSGELKEGDEIVTGTQKPSSGG